MPNVETVKETIEQKIERATGIQIFSFIFSFKHSDDVNRNRYLKLCDKRVEELNKDKYGDWEQAKKEVDFMFEPQYFESRNLTPIKGYPCQFMFTKKRSAIVLINPDNRTYIRWLGEMTHKEVAGIFNT